MAHFIKPYRDQVHWISVRFMKQAVSAFKFCSSSSWLERCPYGYLSS